MRDIMAAGTDNFGTETMFDTAWYRIVPTPAGIDSSSRHGFGRDPQWIPAKSTPE
ncbi:hypothetical protein [Nocardia sp. NPDC127526]|uniref:hypothetical protein n=1 Tax=Nocardia sp. NPDC127526 TaxID=3345393 RepID=UPI00362ABD49